MCEQLGKQQGVYQAPLANNGAAISQWQSVRLLIGRLGRVFDLQPLSDSP